MITGTFQCLLHGLFHNRLRHLFGYRGFNPARELIRRKNTAYQTGQNDQTYHKNNAQARAEIGKYIGYLGTNIDPEKNKLRGEEVILSDEGAKVTVMVIPTNEGNDRRIQIAGPCAHDQALQRSQPHGSIHGFSILHRRYGSVFPVISVIWATRRRQAMKRPGLHWRLTGIAWHGLSRDRKLLIRGDHHHRDFCSLVGQDHFFAAQLICISAEEVINICNKKSGVLGLSGGVSSDFRDLGDAAQAGNEAARTALETYGYRVGKYIGAYVAAMNGVDAIVFTAGVGENNAQILITSSALIPSFCAIKVTIAGSRSPDRVPMIRPSSGVSATIWRRFTTRRI